MNCGNTFLGVGNLFVCFFDSSLRSKSELGLKLITGLGFARDLCCERDSVVLCFAVS